MTVTQVPWFEWGSSGLGYGRAPYNTCSPALVQINHYLSGHARSRSLGCYVVRSVRGGSTISAHSYGGALDVGFPDHATANQWNQWLIDNSEELGVSAIIDERLQAGNKFWMWYPGRGWHLIGAGSAGYLGTHVEIRRDRWGDGRPVEEKLALPPPPPPPGGGYDPWHRNYGLWPLNQQKPTLTLGSGYAPGTQQYQGAAMYFNHVCIFEAGQGQIILPYEVIREPSILAMRNLHAFFNHDGHNAAYSVEAWNGTIGPETWKVIDMLASRGPR